MQHFQSILIVIGLIAIGGVLIHGYFVSRKDKQPELERGTHDDIFTDKAITEEELETADEVISEVRIVSHHREEFETDSIDFSKALTDDKEELFEFKGEPSLKLSEELLNSPSLENEDMLDTLLTDDPDAAQPKTEQPVAGMKTEPVINRGHESEPAKNFEKEIDKEDAPQNQDLFIFNVVAKEGRLLGGHELLQFFLTSGFRHGQMSIFHRHENSDGTGPVLFSIANMMAPGVFDTDNMEQFKSEGVSFFLTAPNKDINIRTSFDLMLRAVEQMAEEFDCEVLNAERKKMTTAQFIEYNNRLLQYI
jgi:cell division protein ZipA